MCLGLALSKSLRVNNAYFKVKLTETMALPLTALRDVLTAKNAQLATSLEYVHRMMQCIDVIYKNHMNKVMVSSGRSPRMFHLPEEQHVTNVIGKTLGSIFYKVRDRFLECSLFQAVS